MNLEALTIQKLEIPFKMSFSHASATRNVTDSIIVIAYSASHTGYGESCPRPYVTDENFDSTSAFFNKYQSSIKASITDIFTLRDWIQTHRDVVDSNPAAWCAIELALLDVLARESQCCVEQLLGQPELSGSFQYTAVLGDMRIESFSKLLQQYSAMGFTDFKVKLSGQLNHDKEKCEVLAGLEHNPRIRFDANNLWSRAEEVISYQGELNYHCFALEEPLQTNDYDGLAQLVDPLKLKIIVDESYLRIQQFEHLTQRPSDWIINIRISKMGGLLRSLDIAEKARQAGIQCIVGAQVGETSLLTRAALTLVNSYRDIVIAQEGAVGTYLLGHDAFQPVLMFGNKGRLDQNQLAQLDCNGFGLKYRG